MADQLPAVQETRPKAAVTVGNSPQALVPTTMEGVWRMAELIAESGMAPRDIKQPAQIAVAIMHGMEVGLTPMQSLQSIAVVNGRPTIWGDGAIALVRASRLLEYFEERIDGEGDQRVAICVVQRKGEERTSRSFSWDDAKKAGLTGKTGPWQQYPNRMMAMRARAFALRDVFADVLRGLSIREEQEDVVASNDSRDNSSTRPKPIEPTVSPDVVEATVVSPVADEVPTVEVVGGPSHETVGQLDAGSSLPPSDPASTPSPDETPPLDFEAVMEEIKTNLSTASEPKHVDEIRDLFSEEYGRMTRSQKSVIDGLFIDAEHRLATPPSGAGTDATTSESVQGGDAQSTSPQSGRDPFDPAIYDDLDDAMVIKGFKAAYAKITDKEGAQRLVNLLKGTKVRRKAMKDENARNALFAEATEILDKYEI